MTNGWSPVRATGVLLAGAPPNVTGLLGTCFAFRHPTYVLTAAHCIADLGPTEMCIALPTHFDRLREPAEIVRHPEADIALLRLESIEDDAGTHAFRDAHSNPSASDFFAFGYPTGVLASDSMPEPRLFKGHFQRFIFPFQPEGSNYRYVAAEMSIPSPAGLSGGPAFHTVATDLVIGMVTANLSSSIAGGEESLEEVLPDGTIRKTIYRHVVNYGIALILNDVRDWLDEHVPPTE
jgi:hypothetical protein